MKYYFASDHRLFTTGRKAFSAAPVSASAVTAVGSIFAEELQVRQKRKHDCFTMKKLCLMLVQWKRKEKNTAERPGGTCTKPHE
jgi:hypothetical protein